jgi:hypothetical protein
MYANSITVGYNASIGEKMEKEKAENKVVLRALGDGLVLRRATPADTEALVAFNAWIHRNPEGEEPEVRVGEWTRDLMARPHPTFQVSDFTIVEDTRAGKIVSSLNLISQTWSYAGIPFGVGRPELVGTHPDYRERGLVRSQFEVIHQWSAARGEKVQAITGIPYYYRLFGYEMALDLGGGRAGYLSQIPKLEEGKEEPYRIRPAMEADLAFIVDLYRSSSSRSLVSAVRDEGLFRYELEGKSEENVNRAVLRIIESAGGERVGYLAHPPYNWGAMLAAIACELIPGVSWGAVMPPVLRYLETQGKEYATEKEPFDSYGFWLGREHPVYQVIPNRLPQVRQPYAWYLRVPDLPGFLRHITPALEDRLSQSPMTGHSGELKLSFYRTGLRMVFEQGRITTVEGWKPAPQGHSGDAGFPGLTFLQLLFGYRSLSELKHAFADCWAGGDGAPALLEALFPKLPSNVWPVA